jgi:hypothetical protein
VAQSDAAGVKATATDGGSVFLTNLTITDHGGIGLLASGSGGVVTITNTLVFGNHPEHYIAGLVTQDHDLFGVDPLFVKPAGGDYRVELLSPALEAGNNRPASGLGPEDLAGDLRLQGRIVDVGAYETHSGCRVLAGGMAPDDNFCRCASDPDMREVRCGFRLPDVFLELRFPLTPDVGVGLPAAWAIVPRRDLPGPYSIVAALRVGAQWKTQTWLGHGGVSLRRDEPVTEPFRVELPQAGPLPLRTTLRYTRSGETPREVQVEVLLPGAVR